MPLEEYVSHLSSGLWVVLLGTVNESAESFIEARVIVSRLTAPNTPGCPPAPTPILGAKHLSLFACLLLADTAYWTRRLDMVLHTCNLSTWEAEAEELGVQRQLDLAQKRGRKGEKEEEEVLALCQIGGVWIPEGFECFSFNKDIVDLPMRIQSSTVTIKSPQANGPDNSIDYFALCRVCPCLGARVETAPSCINARSSYVCLSLHWPAKWPLRIPLL